jgi:ribosomal protein S18 acetylase RimI-like enzyme
MEILELTSADVGSVVDLWVATGLTRPWNDAFDDFRRAIEGTTSAVLGLKNDGELVGTAMVGSDGHRGWVYYVAVRADHQRRGLGSQLMAAAEAWLQENDTAKIRLMVRDANVAALKFYEQLGYEPSDVRVLSKSLPQ